MTEEQIDNLRHYKENEESYRSLRAALTWNYEDFIPNRKISFLEIALGYVLSKTPLECYDVRFLCWLKTQYNLPVPIQLNLPFICTPVQVKTEDFEKKYVFNETRKNLFNQLSQFINYLKKQNNLASIDILFGGSYMDIEKESPNDIDIAILIPEGEEGNYNFNEASQKADKAIPEVVDMKFLPTNLDLSSYKVYSRIVILGNKPKYKDSDPIGTDFKSNTFEISGITTIRL